MKISLWQQFSSNHSARFTIAGRFKSAKDANDAAEKIKQLLQHILLEEPKYRSDLTQAERQVSEAYYIEWYEEGIDWHFSEADIVNLIRVVGNDIFMKNEFETNQTPIPFAGLMWKLGAQRVDYARTEPVYFKLRVDLRCEAPDEMTAKTFYEHTREYLSDDSAGNVRNPVWEINPDDPSSASGIIWRRDRKIAMSLQFWDTVYSVDALVNYLNRNGFTNIQYDFYSDREWDEKTSSWFWSQTWPSWMEE